MISMFHLVETYLGMLPVDLHIYSGQIKICGGPKVIVGVVQNFYISLNTQKFGAYKCVNMPHNPIFWTLKITHCIWAFHSTRDYFFQNSIVKVVKFRYKYNGIWCECHTRKRCSAIKPGSIHHFLHLRMPVPNQEYDSCFPFLWCVLSFDFAIGSGTFRFEYSSEFSIFVILPFF